MQILTGLFDHMVLQRNSSGVSDALITGETTSTGDVLASVRDKADKAVKGFGKPVVIGKAARGKFSATLKGLPAGGPYDVYLVIVGKDKENVGVVVKDVLVGDVWIAAGQSNMQGAGRTAQRAIPQENVRAFYMGDTWAVAEDPIHQLDFAVDAVHNGGNRTPKPNINNNGTGPSVAFAQVMAQHTGVPQGLIVSAHGGTSMAQWDPALKSQGGKSLYGANLRRCIKNGGKVAGMIWYQGESDANPQVSHLYTERMKTLVKELRKDLKHPTLPVAIVQISRVIGWGDATHWNSIQDQQSKLPNVIKNLAVVPAIDLTLDDTIHISGVDQNRLGVRLANAAQHLLDGAKGPQAPIAFKAITTAVDPVTITVNFLVEFDNVEGDLISAGRPVGFSVIAPNGTQQVYDTLLDGNTAILRTGIQQSQLHVSGEITLHYGLGTDPVCNITDEADRSLPVFGPIRFASEKALTRYFTKPRISAVFPGAGKLEGLKLPSDLPFESRQFNGQFLDRHHEWQRPGAPDEVVYYAFKFETAEAMKLALSIGCDGPIKVWYDAKEVFHDGSGTNPAVSDAKQVKVDANAGTHEVIVALGTNEGRAWGIFFRIERLDVSVKQLKQGAGAYTLPILLE